MATEYIVAVFPSRGVMMRALERVTKLDYVDIRRAAIVVKATSGETVVLNDGIGPDEGGIAGGTLGAAMTMLGLAQLGALALPGVGVVIALGAGALVGGLVGRATGRFAINLLDQGFAKTQIEALARRLQAGHPALVLEVKQRELVLPRLRADLRAYRAELVEPLEEAERAPALMG
jgi:uncharacterized membrane protein